MIVYYNVKKHQDTMACGGLIVLEAENITPQARAIARQRREDIRDFGTAAAAVTIFTAGVLYFAPGSPLNLATTPPDIAGGMIALAAGLSACAHSLGKNVADGIARRKLRKLGMRQ